jgi:hypothetical protein
MDGDPLLDAAPAAALPDALALLGWVRAWRAGAVTLDGLRERAHAVVAAHVLPVLSPADPASVAIEALLELSADGPGAITDADAGALEAFLAGNRRPAEAWAAWWAWRGR